MKRSIKPILVQEMVERQQSSIDPKHRLSAHYLRTVSKYIDSSIFHQSQCCLWSGYITTNGMKYVNLYHNGKKMNLHRLLYHNFVGPLYDNQYLAYTCANKGVCCNINHVEIKLQRRKKNAKAKASIFVVDFF
jgi:hypothetical protein